MTFQKTASCAESIATTIAVPTNRTPRDDPRHHHPAVCIRQGYGSGVIGVSTCNISPRTDVAKLVVLEGEDNGHRPLVRQRSSTVPAWLPHPLLQEYQGKEPVKWSGPSGGGMQPLLRCTSSELSRRY